MAVTVTRGVVGRSPCPVQEPRAGAGTTKLSTGVRVVGGKLRSLGVETDPELCSWVRPFPSIFTQTDEMGAEERTWACMLLISENICVALDALIKFKKWAQWLHWKNDLASLVNRSTIFLERKKYQKMKREKTEYLEFIFLLTQWKHVKIDLFLPEKVLISILW